MTAPSPPPSKEAVRLMHRIRTRGHVTEFSITDKEAAAEIDRYAAERAVAAQKVIEALRAYIKHGSANRWDEVAETLAAYDAERQAGEGET